MYQVEGSSPSRRSVKKQREEINQIISLIVEQYSGKEFEFKDLLEAFYGPNPSQKNLRRMRNLLHRTMVKERGIVEKVGERKSENGGANIAIYKIKDASPAVPSVSPKFPESADNVTTSEIGESLVRYIEEIKEENEILKRQNENLQSENYQLRQRVDNLNKRLASTAGSPVSIKQLMG